MRRLLLALIVTLLWLPSGAAAEVAVQAYSLPAGGGPHDVAVGADGIVWYTAQRGGQLGRQQAELVMNPGDALFLKSCTPHLVETTGEHSLHMSFDIVDRHLNVETTLELLLDQYKKDSAPCYTPADGIVQKLVAHTASSDYRARVAQLQAMHKENYARARQFFGANRVHALDRWLPSTSR